MRRFLTIAAIVGSCVAGTVASGPTIQAQAQVPETSVELIDQSPFVHAGNSLELRLGLNGVDPSWTVQLTPHSPGTTKVVDAQGRETSRVTLDELLGIMAGTRPLGASRGVLTIPVGDLPVDPDGGVAISVPTVGGPTVAGPTLGDPVGDPGSGGALDVPVPRDRVGVVYPLEIGLLDPDGRSVGRSVVTFVVVLSRARQVRAGCDPSEGTVVSCRQLSLAWLWRMSTEQPAHRPDGTLEPLVRADLVEGGRLACLVELAAAGAVPLTLIPDPELLDRWQAGIAAEQDLETAAPTPDPTTTTTPTTSTSTSTTAPTAAAPTATDPPAASTVPATAPAPPTGVTTTPAANAVTTTTAVAEPTPAPPACRAGTLLDGLATLRALTGPDWRGRSEVLRQPYVPLDLPAMEAANLDDEIREQLNRGRLTLDTALGSRADVDTTTMLLDRADVDVLVRLRDSGVTRVVVEPSQLAEVVPVEGVTIGRPTTIGIAGDDRVDAAVTNPGIEALLHDDAPAPLRVHRFLAAVSFAALERPTETRGVVLLSRWEAPPDPGVVHALLELLDDHPLIRMRTLSDFFGTVEREQGESALIERELQLLEQQPLVVNGSTIAETRNILGAYERWIGADAAADVLQGRRNVLIAERSRLGVEAAQAFLDAATAPINALRNQVTFRTSSKLTITARRAQLGVQFTNASTRPVEVRLELSGPKVRFLDAPGVGQTIELQPGPSEQTFHFEVRSSGDSSLRVTMSSPDSGIPLGTQDVRIRSFAFSGLAAWITVAAAVFLALWWGTHHRAIRRRRSDRARANPPGPGLPADS